MEKDLFMSIGGKLPTRKHHNDAGFDLYASEDRSLYPFTQDVIPTGVTVNLPPNTVGLIMAKSRSQYIVGAGVVDQGYKGELKVRIFANNERVDIETGNAIAQILIAKLHPIDYQSEVSGERLDTGGINQEV